MSLLDQVSSFENLYQAFLECSKGKRKARGYQESLFGIGEKLLLIADAFKNNSYKWGKYREFYVHDPKKRLIMAAPFMDRVVHHAIHRVIEPIIDRHFLPYTYACRTGKGNRNAVQNLFSFLQNNLTSRFTVKLDVKKYFQTINHKILYKQLMTSLPDQSLSSLLWSLITSHPIQKQEGRGIPVGNLTSQLFANLYLSPVDAFLHNLIGDDIAKGTNYYIRYMDDLVIVTPTKQRALEITYKVREFARDHLLLDIPFNKVSYLGNCPVPFLGFLLQESHYDVLSRNKRRFKKKILKMKKSNYMCSSIAEVQISYNAWSKLENG